MTRIQKNGDLLIQYKRQRRLRLYTILQMDCDIKTQKVTSYFNVVYQVDGKLEVTVQNYENPSSKNFLSFLKSTFS